MIRQLDAVGAPPLDASTELQTDWLELSAFFSKRGVARLDRLDGALVIQEEDQLSDDAQADAIADERRSLIEEEVDFRSSALGQAYPFVLSEDGEEMRFKDPAERRGGIFYLLCLVVSHFHASPILISPPEPADVARVRKEQFQVLATLAVAGMLGGPAVSMGWPRASDETILQVLTRITQMAGVGVPRQAPGNEASPAAKDGGMDVIGWQVANNNQPPPIAMYFGQVASGKNWAGKSAVQEIDVFIASYYTERPETNYAAVTVIPHRLSKEEHVRYGKRHGHILDRLRTPRAALTGYELGKSGVHVDGHANVGSIGSWLYDYRRTRLAA